MSSSFYTVANSHVVAEQFRSAIQVARTSGLFVQVVRASRWILDELTHNPGSFGESREVLPVLDLSLRIGFAGPLYVIFGVHEPSRTVFVRKIGFSKRTV